MKIVLAEKPSVARDIATYLKATQRRNGYLEGNDWAVTWAFGHLVELQEPEEYKPEWKSWRIDSLPMIPSPFELRPRAEKSVQEQLETIVKLFQDSDEIICATDAGREGELIFRYILSWAKCENKPFKRLWISSLTKQAIAKGFEKLSQGSDFDPLYHAAKCRSEADWIVGLNATRFFTVEYGKRNLLLSIGRVQTPILAMIVGRDHEIEKFDSNDYWEVHTVAHGAKFRHVKGKFEQLPNAEAIVRKVTGQELIIKGVQKKNENANAPQLYDLTELQRDLNKRYGFTADQTLRIAQNLYESKHITYPRTDSRYLTSDLKPTIAPLLEKFRPHRSKAIDQLDLQNLKFTNRIVDDKKVSDHHAIIPTDELPSKLNHDEKKLYDAVLTRLIAVFYPPCVKAITTVDAQSANEPFRVRGTVLVDLGWQALYPGSAKATSAKKAAKKTTSAQSLEQTLPDFQEGERYSHKPSIEKFRTSPPKRFTEASLLQLMETAGKIVNDEELKEALKDKGVGTPATRASIIEVLIQRNYIERKRKNLISTSNGRQLIALVQNKRLKSPELTGDWEFRLKQMERGEYNPQKFMTEVESYTREILDATAEKTINLKNLGPCPCCGAPVIRGKTGYGCSQWRDGCKFSLKEDSLGMRISATLVRELLLNKRTLTAHGVQNKGKRALATLTFDKKGKLNYTLAETAAKPSNQNAIGSCPSCGGDISDNPKGYGCANWREGCKFIIWKTIAKKEISLEVAQELLKNGETPPIEGFLSKAGKPFSAKLKLINSEVKFAFAD
ncbi:MAG: DNA topoisomerase 3 [Opitutales bacterium]|nr:DNA topoisomerase 3 [Opitutales bacterium]